MANEFKYKLNLCLKQSQKLPYSIPPIRDIQTTVSNGNTATLSAKCTLHLTNSGIKLAFWFVTEKAPLRCLQKEANNIN